MVFEAEIFGGILWDGGASCDGDLAGLTNRTREQGGEFATAAAGWPLPSFWLVLDASFFMSTEFGDSA